MTLLRALIAGAAIFCASSALACGADTDCRIGDRIYRIALPTGYDGAPVGALVWAHGYRGTAEGAMRNQSLRRMVSAAGLALITAQGVDGSWELPNGPRTINSTGAAEFDYFNAVLDDASDRFAIDRDRVIAAGFSAGGMMVWNLACARPDLFAGFIPISGTFWLGPPDACAAPVTNIIHIHGDADKTVPLNGRAIGNTRQGKVADALAMYTDFGAFGPVQQSSTGPLSCRNRADAAGDILEFCLFAGGHSFRTEYLAYGIDRLRKAGKL